MKFFNKPFKWAITYTLIIIVSTTLVLLDTFVIPRAVSPIYTAEPTGSSAEATDSTEDTSNNSIAKISEKTYKDDNISITIETIREYSTTFYVADVQISNVKYLKTAFANNTYGRNIKDTTSDMAIDNKAIFAINGDYYGFRDYGFVLRNGVLYRDTARSAGNDEALAIDSKGNFSIINESKTSSQTLKDSNIWQVLSFGPALINNSVISVDANSEVSQSMNSNPRTAIGQISALHYIVIVSDGRTSESTGLSLLQLAQEFNERGCSVAYNLDGGGSSTMWFNGQVINTPVSGGKSSSSSERSVSDIVYIGY